MYCKLNCVLMDLKLFMSPGSKKWRHDSSKRLRAGDSYTREKTNSTSWRNSFKGQKIVNYRGKLETLPMEGW